MMKDAELKHIPAEKAPADFDLNSYSSRIFDMLKGKTEDVVLNCSNHTMKDLIDRFGKLRFAVPAAAIMLLGLIGMYFVRRSAAVILAGTVMMSGYMMLSAALSANIRDWTPAGKVGHFQGIRMIYAVLLPMIIGPSIGAAVIRGSDSTYIDLGQVKTVPTPEIYLAAAAVLLLVAVPVAALRRREQKK